MDDIVKALTAKDDLRLRITDHEDGTFRFALLSNGMERGIKLLNMRLMEGQRAPIGRTLTTSSMPPSPLTVHARSSRLPRWLTIS